ncbi:MAG: TIGR02452 family protein [Moheibacter sp.]
MNIEFDSNEWLNEFHIASKNKYGFRELRAEIFQQTVEAVKKDGYSLKDKEIKIDEPLPGDTVFYERPNKLDPSKNDYETKISVIEADCLETADLIRKMGFKVCVLNMASRQNPGGGVLGGAGAQEENIFRRSNLLSSLYQFVDYSKQYGVKRNADNSYPLNPESGGIYSRGITVFRSSETSGYSFLEKPYKMNFVSVPAINGPKLIKKDDIYFIDDQLIDPTKEKIRTILRIGKTDENDAIVLSAFGCGAFGNPPEHMARLFNEVFSEPEFQNQYRLIVFSIINDHNAKKEHNPNGNLIPFIYEFC